MPTKGTLLNLMQFVHVDDVSLLLRNRERMTGVPTRGPQRRRAAGVEVGSPFWVVVAT